MLINKLNNCSIVSKRINRVTFFWMAAAVMALAVIIAFVLYSRKIYSSFYVNSQKSQHQNTNALEAAALDREQSNLSLYRSRCEEIKQQLEFGDIDENTAEALQFETKKQLLSDTASSNAQPQIQQQDANTYENITGKHGLIVIALLAVSIPVCAIVLYLPFGLSLGSVDQWQVRNQLSYIETLNDSQKRQAAIIDLAELLEEQTRSLLPDEALLNLLAEVYLNLGEYSKSTPIYQQLLASNNENAYFYASLAEALYLQSFSNPSRAVKTDDSNTSVKIDEISRLLSQSLEIQPQEAKALSLSGMIAFQQKSWQKAIDFWERALLVYPAHSSQAQTLNNGIASAKGNLGQQDTRQSLSLNGADGKNKTVVSGHETITAAVKVLISIDRSLITQDDAQSTPIFIFARPANGTRMPLAAKRITLADLPAEIVLTNHDRMAAQTIAEHSRVIVGARLARSGQPIPKSGDIDSKEHEVTVNPIESGSQIGSLPSTALHIDILRQ